MEGYAADLVLPICGAVEPKEEQAVSREQVREFVQRALEGSSRYEDTPGSGRGVDLKSGRLLGRGVALSENVIHISVQIRNPGPPAKPIVQPYGPPVTR